ncbi:hypothetical protein BGZ95_003443 [Linnemannia exigua]|uniref:Uncharacterized protein n=1 Tax=Linnemannia exigua TaxID=604196 RepID=A0AAD4DI29_9FUNG|nr:hypothetical protein BGZ95_003443 [Linnemannia exigua]
MPGSALHGYVQQLCGDRFTYNDDLKDVDYEEDEEEKEKKKKEEEQEEEKDVSGNQERSASRYSFPETTSIRLAFTPSSAVGVTSMSSPTWTQMCILRGLSTRLTLGQDDPSDKKPILMAL